MVRPLVLLFQEFAEQTVAPTTPDLNTILLGPAYQIYDYPDDKTLTEVTSYGARNQQVSLLPPANVPAITLAGLPGAAPGSWVDPESIRVFFDEAHVVLTQGTDGVTTTMPPYENYLQSATAQFITNGVRAGDTVVILPGDGMFVLPILEVESESLIRVASNIPVATSTAYFHVERKVNNEEIGKTFIIRPTFREGNELKILGGVTLPVNGVERTVIDARVYVAYRALRTDLTKIDSVSSKNEIVSKIGRIDSRNPLSVGLFVARQNAGQSPLYFYGVSSDDLQGYESARDAISVTDSLYAIVPLTQDLNVIAAFKAENEQLADPTRAINDGIPQKFRVVIGSGTLPTSSVKVPEESTGQIEQQADSAPFRASQLEIQGLNALSTRLKPGDKIAISASNAPRTLDGTYTIAHINDETHVEIDEELRGGGSQFPIAMNFTVTRPSTNEVLVGPYDYRITTGRDGVTYTNRIAGVQTPARRIIFQQDVTTAGGINRITEVAGASTTVFADFASNSITAKQLVNAFKGQGATVPFAGSVNFKVDLADENNDPVQTIGTDITFDESAYGGPVPAVLLGASRPDDIYNRLYDPNASFITADVGPGDILEIPKDPSGSFGGQNRRFVIDQVLSEQRLRIVNQDKGVFRSNTSTNEYELPHGDNRLGTGTIIDGFNMRYRVIRELTKDQQIANMVAISQSFNSRRALLTWPDRVLVAGLVDGSKPKNADGTLALAGPQPGYYLSAVLGGMTAGLPSQQGFSRLGIAGISKLEHSNDHFSDKQLTDLSDGGWYVFAQNSPMSLPYSLHQLTTDPATLESGEFSIVKNFDFVSLFFLGVLEPFLGVWNINNDTMGFVRQAMNTGIEQLKLRRVAKIGAPLKEATLTSVMQSPASADRIEVYIRVGLPKPLNVIGLHLVA